MIEESFQLRFGMTTSRDDNKETEKPDDPNWIRIMRSIVYCVVILVFASVCAYRLLNAHPNLSSVDLSKIDLSQILSLILALFSIWLSATFYFKATDTSNKFYDRTYGLTKDLFEILGRMEERFGEMLKSIHEDTSATRQEFSQTKNERKVVIETVETTSVPTDEVKGTSVPKEKA